MARPDLGIKRTCATCGTKFYDLNKDPILCPKCGAAFIIAAPAVVANAGALKSVIAADLPADLIDPTEDLISLEDLEADGADKDSVDGVDEDDTFLEEEEDDTNVTDFIDGDIEDEDES